MMTAKRILDTENPTTLSSGQARRLCVECQLLGERAAPPSGKEGVVSIVEHLGYVQIDTISVIERAHHHVIWTRVPDYNSAMLHELQAMDRTIFEYWGHAASYLPMKDYRYYLERMKSFPQGWNYWTKELFDKYRTVMKQVMDRIRKEGPMGSADFENPKGDKRGTWWDWKPAKAALEMLFWKGDLMVTERRNFQRIYDLTERVLPSWVDTRIPDKDEIGRFLATRALKAGGLATAKEIRDHIHLTDQKGIEKAIMELLDSDEVVEVKVEGLGDKKYYSLNESMEKVLTGKEEKTRGGGRAYLLSPFDNLVIQRERVKRLFGFDYQLECYVPKDKRKNGYFMLPILWGEELVGKLDPKAERKEGVLTIRNVLFEKEFNEFDALLPELATAVKALARFNGLDKVRVEKVSPGRLKPFLNKELSK